MKKILVIIGTRPEAIKLFPVVHALRDHPEFECVVCTTGQHREMVDEVLDFVGVVPDYRLDAMRAGQSLDKLTARLTTLIGPVIDKVAPDWVIVQGDTTSAFCGALSAYYRRIRVCHVEAGLRTGDIYGPWPEEANRKMIATMAALHCAPTEGAADNLRSEGVAQEAIHVTGNTVVDALIWTRRRLEENPATASELLGINHRFTGRKVVIATCHRRETRGRGMREIAEILTRIAQRSDTLIVFPLHPDPGVQAFFSSRLGGVDNVVLIKPLPYHRFIGLLMLSNLILTDSGGIQEEAAFLEIPTLVLRQKTERVEGLRTGLAKLMDMQLDDTFAAINSILDQKVESEAANFGSTLYGDGSAGKHIVKLLLECHEVIRVKSSFIPTP
ncbi:MAG: UDP-N-acetylglucosamine 2-epimerase (non-hydrolyzing) [Sphingomonadaceae bacterium]